MGTDSDVNILSIIVKNNFDFLCIPRYFNRTCSNVRISLYEVRVPKKKATSLISRRSEDAMLLIASTYKLWLPSITFPF